MQRVVGYTRGREIGNGVVAQLHLAQAPIRQPEEELAIRLKMARGSSHLGGSAQLGEGKGLGIDAPEAATLGQHVDRAGGTHQFSAAG